MKKIILSIAIASLALGFTSCGSDEPAGSTIGFPALNIIAPVDGSQPTAASAQYRMQYRHDGSMVFSESGLRIDGRDYSFTSHEGTYTTTQYVNGVIYSSNLGSFSSAEGSVVSISDLKTRAFFNFGYPTSAFPTIAMGANIPGLLTASYTIDNVADILTFAQDSFYFGTTSSNTGFSGTASSYRLIFSVNDDGKVLPDASVIIYNAQFDSKMPAIDMLALTGLNVTFSKDGFIVKGENLKSLYYSAGEGVMENPAFGFDSFKLTTTPGNPSEANIEFSVASGRFTATALVNNMP